MANAKPCPTPTTFGNKLSLNDSSTFSQLSLYVSPIRALQYLTMIRPNISLAVNKLSQFPYAKNCH